MEEKRHSPQGVIPGKADGDQLRCPWCGGASADQQTQTCRLGIAADSWLLTGRRVIAGQRRGRHQATITGENVMREMRGLGGDGIESRGWRDREA
jgi:hypothetical protein